MVETLMDLSGGCCIRGSDGELQLELHFLGGSVLAYRFLVCYLHTNLDDNRLS